MTHYRQKFALCQEKIITDNFIQSSILACVFYGGIQIEIDYD